MKSTEKLAPTNNKENKIRLCFSKMDTLRFIGHLDFLRIFQQAIRRSGLPIAYSQGFNPHQIISFALPLPLGMISVNDYADITLTTKVSANEIVDNINAVAPQGLHIQAAYAVKGAAAAAATTVADYALKTSMLQDKLQEAVSKLLKAETLIIPKKTKSGIKNTDIRPDIFTIDLTAEGLKMRLSAGSGRFLNPLLVAEQVLQTVPCTSALARLELYQDDGGGGVVPLIKC